MKLERVLTPEGWLIVEAEKPGMTASEVELSKKLLHTQAEILALEGRIEKVEIVVEAGLIARGSSIE